MFFIKQRILTTFVFCIVFGAILLAIIKLKLKMAILKIIIFCVKHSYIWELAVSLTDRPCKH